MKVEEFLWELNQQHEDPEKVEKYEKSNMLGLEKNVSNFVI